jgi:CheY-like chemotaxis protein
MDYQMPNMDGPTSVKCMRDAGYNGLIIGVTGNALPADLKYFEDQGADNVITKPVRMSQIENIINF